MPNHTVAINMVMEALQDKRARRDRKAQMRSPQSDTAYSYAGVVYSESVVVKRRR